MAEKQTLAAIMRSMSDGLILTDVAGRVLYANPGAGAMTGLPATALDGSHIEAIHASAARPGAGPGAYDASASRVRRPASCPPGCWRPRSGGHIPGDQPAPVRRAR